MRHISVKAFEGCMIQCPNCRQAVGEVLRDIPDDAQITFEYIVLNHTNIIGGAGPVCEHCRHDAAFHQDDGWSIVVGGRMRQ
jgi:hypothetical protein